MVPDAKVEILVDSPSSLVIQAHGAMGAPVGVRAMESVIDKAKGDGAALACVRDSTHFRIAGYYAMLALREDMLGVAMTNTAALGVPILGRQVMVGTSRLAFAAPADPERGFVLYVATTVVTRGKIETYERQSKALPSGWVVDKTGRPATDAGVILDDMFHRVGGGIMPPGGAGELLSGYKGCGLAITVDVLCAVLCGAPFGPEACDTAKSSGWDSHFFGAIKIDTIRDAREFRRDMARKLRTLRESPRAEGEERVYFAGQKEFEKEDECLLLGAPLSEVTFDRIGEIGVESAVECPPILGVT